MNSKNLDLENRLIDFAVKIILLSNQLPDNNTGDHVRDQIVHSVTSPAPNYGEAQKAESR